MSDDRTRSAVTQSPLTSWPNSLRALDRSWWRGFEEPRYSSLATCGRLDGEPLPNLGLGVEVARLLKSVFEAPHGLVGHCEEIDLNMMATEVRPSHRDRIVTVIARPLEHVLHTLALLGADNSPMWTRL